MKLLKEIFHQPAALLGAVLLGAWTGMVWPQGAGLFAALSAIYLSLVQAMALPFLVLAAYAGLRRIAGTGVRWRRTGALAVCGLLAMLLCAVSGAMLAGASAAGAGMGPSRAASLGRLALEAEAPLEINLHADHPAQAAGHDSPGLVPRNLYAVMVSGSAPSVLIGVLLFGAAVAVQRGSAAGRLNGMLDAAYRGIELAIRSVNAGLPLTAFVLAAAATSAAGGESIGLLTSFLGAWYGAVLTVSAPAVAAICWRLKAHPWRVMAALREPVTVCLFAPVGAAALPEFIEALSVRLGLARGVVELLASVCPVFLRTGEALFFAVLAVFIANVYGRPPALADIVLIALLSCWTALGAVGVAGSSTVLWSGALQASLGLPLGAMLPVLAMVEALCEGGRNLVSYLTAAALAAAATDALPLPQAVPAGSAPSGAALRLVVPRREAWLGLTLLGAALLFMFCAGLGVGLRNVLLTAL